jgi:hypothetical protein
MKDTDMNEVKIICWMVNAAGERKPLVREDARADLKAKGWKEEDVKAPTEREILLEKAEKLGLNLAKNTPTDKLAAAVQEAEEKASK